MHSKLRKKSHFLRTPPKPKLNYSVTLHLDLALQQVRQIRFNRKTEKWLLINVKEKDFTSRQKDTSSFKLQDKTGHQVYIYILTRHP
jgi:hypothetical protein